MAFVVQAGSGVFYAVTVFVVVAVGGVVVEKVRKARCRRLSRGAAVVISGHHTISLFRSSRDWG